MMMTTFLLMVMEVLLLLMKISYLNGLVMALFCTCFTASHSHGHDDNTKAEADRPLRNVAGSALDDARCRLGMRAL